MGHLVKRVAARRHVAVAVATQIVGKDSEVIPEERDDLEVPDGEIAGQAVDHHEVRALADLLIVQFDAAAECRLRHAILRRYYSTYPSIRRRRSIVSSSSALSVATVVIGSA